MRRILVAFLSLVFVAPALSQEAKPNTVTPKEIADGWILLFDGETTFGWNLEGEVAVANGSLMLVGKKARAQHATAWGNHELRFEYRLDNPDNQGDADLDVQDRAGHSLQATNGNWYQVRQHYDFDPESGRYVSQDIVGFPKQTIKGGGRVAQQRRPGTVAAPKVGFEIYRVAKLEVRNIKLKPIAKTLFKPKFDDNPQTIALESLFNGKDLAGWKIFPGKKSEFAVIDGAINIKDGPGDLQTEKQFGDFLLQMECISHGKHLNSGVFFRCRPNEYQNGYEAQVRNEFTDKPTQKYLLEEYDPATNKLLGKKEAMFTAVDFGTGAIYRRQPARKEMSKDGEWFTMTVAAHGNHIATWVNGVQVTDWFDHRPKSDNARTGCRLEAGHISLQGHDPTTNLSFRNFRIQEYPTAK